MPTSTPRSPPPAAAGSPPKKPRAKSSTSFTPKTSSSSTPPAPSPPHPPLPPRLWSLPLQAQRGPAGRGEGGFSPPLRDLTCQPPSDNVRLPDAGWSSPARTPPDHPGRPADLFRRYVVIPPLRCAPASPSSGFLVSPSTLLVAV